MSTDNTGIIVAGLIVAYLYTKRTQPGYVAVRAAPAPLPASMPASVGSGVKQIAVGALAGLLQGLASGPANNTSQTYFPSYSAIDNASVAQESAGYVAPGAADLIDTNDYGWFA